jgi:hypothetical protein
MLTPRTVKISATSGAECQEHAFLILRAPRLEPIMGRGACAIEERNDGAVLHERVSTT